MSTEENWALNADRKEHDRAVKQLEGVKAGQPKMKTVRVGDTYLQFDARLSDKEIEKRVKNFKKYMQER